MSALIHTICDVSASLIKSKSNTEAAIKLTDAYGPEREKLYACLSHINNALADLEDIAYATATNN